jgi:hypothetical protein
MENMATNGTPSMPLTTERLIGLLETVNATPSFLAELSRYPTRAVAPTFGKPA